ncbi:MAG TPA: glycosyltransferase [Chitinophagaceae bacterium]|nr:glycosyltransferase [Chitinophagaceae bacterium]
MHSKKVLWLCSWYPSRLEPFNGDFIQRHAQAASIYKDITVIYVVRDFKGEVTKSIYTETKKQNSLTEITIFYYVMAARINFFEKIASFRKYKSVYKAAIRKYFEENGKPALVHVHIPVKAGLLGLWIKRKYKVPYILTEHWGIYNNVEEANYQSKSAFFKRISKQIFREAKKFISVSKYLGIGVNKLVTKKDFEIIPNAVRTDLFYFNEKPVSISRFIHVSGMIPLKNAEGILRAFKIVSEKNIKTELVMVGDTNPFIRKFAAELGLKEDIVRFCGEVPYEVVAEEMQQACCFVLFSHIENSPCVISEALSCGLPVIATNVGGIPELIEEYNGIMVVPGDEEALAAAMLFVINNQHRYNRNEIAETAKRKFSYNVIGKKIEEVYNAAIR